ncbi:MAG: divalent-cation tolerance protein CutA [Acidobacteriota bacterium]|nr:divalent-cation tolerance protein CutA [Acidobacteriota bacterium]
MSAIVVVTTVGTQEQANGIAEELVGRRHAACVNILNVARSVYRWQGQVCDDSEYLLVIKTLDSAFEEVQATIQELHQYDLPEILSFGVGRGEENFLRWIEDSVGGGTLAGDGAWPPEGAAEKGE